MHNALSAPDGRVVACVIKQQGRYLLCQRPKGKRYAGLWEFPGGKLHAEEDLVAAARRELREELNLELKAAGRCLFEQADPASGLVICFLEVTVSGKPCLIEHAALWWATLDELPARQLAPSDSEFVKYLTSERARERC